MDSKMKQLDNTKIDYLVNHGFASNEIRGVYPPGTTQAEVVEKVRGPWGGKMTRFGNGEFYYIAYMD